MQKFIISKNTIIVTQIARDISAEEINMDDITKFLNDEEATLIERDGDRYLQAKLDHDPSITMQAMYIGRTEDGLQIKALLTRELPLAFAMQLGSADKYAFNYVSFEGLRAKALEAKTVLKESVLKEVDGLYVTTEDPDAETVVELI